MAYWERYLRARVARRRVLAGVASVSAAGAFLAACGGDDDDSPSDQGGTGSSPTPGNGGGSSLLTTPTDTSSEARPGGTLRTFSRDETSSLDVLTSGDSTTYSLVGDKTYPALVKFDTGAYPEAPSGELLGDLAEDWEIAGDRLSITFRLRPGLHWDNKSPVDGREIDAEDVVASWNRFAALSGYSGQVAYSADNPTGAVESFEALDSHTVRANLPSPDPAALSLLGWNRVRIMPREFDGGFDPASEVIGYGPYLLEEYVPSVGFNWRRNPDYHIQDRPFIERIEQVIVPEYASQLSQFVAGNIYTHVASPDDVLQIKNDNPELLLMEGDSHVPYHGITLTFGYEGEGAKFKDIRIRQAINHLMDRKGYENLITNKDDLAAQGIEIDTKLCTWLGPYWGDYWLDPFDESAFGAEARYFEFDVAEAQKLLSAAGFPDGFDTGVFYPMGRGGWQQQLADIVPSLLNAGGINASGEGVDNSGVFIPNMLRGYAGGSLPTGAATDGIQLIAGGVRVTASLILSNYYDPGGPSYVGMPVDNGSPLDGDPDVVDLVRGIRTEFDRETQVSLTHDFHRLMAERAYAIPLHWSTRGGGVTSASGLRLVWPVLGNYQAFTQSPSGTPPTESQMHWWIDDTKPPLA